MRSFEDTEALVAGAVAGLWRGEELPDTVDHVYGFPLGWDVDGFVTVRSGPPVWVAVTAPIACCPPTPALLAEVNDLNAASRWVRFHVDADGELVWASYGILADAVTPFALSAAIDWVHYAADSFGPLLAPAAVTVDPPDQERL